MDREDKRGLVDREGLERRAPRACGESVARRLNGAGIAGELVETVEANLDVEWLPRAGGAPR